MFRPLACSAAMAMAAMAHAQTTSVDLRIVEQTGQSQVLFSNGASPDAVLDFAVQVRVNGGSALGGVGFDLVILGETDTKGTLALNLISNDDHTYAGLPPIANPVVGSGGLAFSYTYLAAINNAFNGKINASSGEFTHNPANAEIGLITGATVGSTLFGTPGLDPSHQGSPSTWSGYGSGNSPTVGNTAAFPASVGPTYFAQGQFIDVYRFRYTVTDLSQRTLHLTLQNVRLQTAPRFIFGQTTGWGMDNTTWSGLVTVTDLSAPIVLAPQGTCCDGTTGACTSVAQFACAGSNTWAFGGVCQPNPCPQPGTCCAPAGACLFVVQTACAADSVWNSVGGACQPNPCPQQGTCCAPAGTCSFGTQIECAPGSAWTSGGTCSPNTCPQPGTCCASEGTCTFGLRGACTSGSVWAIGGTCSPNTCQQPGTCCSAQGNCTFGLPSACASGSVWAAGGTCSPNTCQQPGTCCSAQGTCTFGLPSACASGSVWAADGTCLPNPCPQLGACCAADGACTPVLQSACAQGSVWTSGGICNPNPCPQLGSCCAADGACTSVLQSACESGSVWTSGGACNPNSCPQPGTCCGADGACTTVLQSACVQGSAWTSGGACNPNPCPQPGNCCAPQGACSFVLESACAPGSVWNLGGTCNPSPCPTTGACCRGSICQLALPAECTGQFARFTGTGVACNAAGNNSTPCCKADFSGDGIAVQDIFDFLNAWLATDARADFNGDGLAVQDIFDFLNAWFAGCH